MINKLLCIIALGVILGFSTAGAQTAPAADARVKGQIVAARVQGHVTAISKATQESRLLHDGDLVSEQTTIATGPGASVILAFSNGATVDVAADSKLDVAEFEQDPFSTSIKASDIKQEAGTSVTRLNLTRGELVGRVAHLNVDKGSEFTVRTPVGAAGIRGTVVGVIFIPLKGGKAHFEIETFEGLVAFTPGGGGNPILIPAGHKFDETVEFKPTDVDNPWDWLPPPPPTVELLFLSPDEAAHFQAELRNILGALENIDFPQSLGTPPPPPPPAPPMNAPTPGAGTGP
jgi:ferric-dicitrate binding protein FerR (iron transport regulator)